MIYLTTVTMPYSTANADQAAALPNFDSLSTEPISLPCATRYTASGVGTGRRHKPTATARMDKIGWGVPLCRRWHSTDGVVLRH